MKRVRSEDLGGEARSNLVGIMGSLVEIGLTDLPKNGGTCRHYHQTWL